MNLAINVTFVGLTVVFISLILLSLLIVAFGKVLNSKNKESSSNIDEASNIEDDAPNQLETVENSESDGELVAILTAAILASMKDSTKCKIRVKSFRRVEVSSPVWNVAGRTEQILGKL